MTAPVGTTPPTTPTTPSTDSQVLGKDDFLQMLVTQLKNQDPMSPMDGTQFAAQLAQFSTVEQLIDMNSKLDAQTSAAAQTQIANQASFASSLVGRDVILNGAKVDVIAGSQARINVDLTGAAKTVHVDVLDTDGKTVLASQDFSDVAAGSQTLTFDPGKLAPGSYSYNVTAVDSSNQAVTATGNTIGTVGSTVFQNGQVMVRVDGTAVPVTDITEILPAATSSATTTN